MAFIPAYKIPAVSGDDQPEVFITFLEADAFAAGPAFLADQLAVYPVVQTGGGSNDAVGYGG